MREGHMDGTQIINNVKLEYINEIFNAYCGTHKGDAYLMDTVPSLDVNSTDFEGYVNRILNPQNEGTVLVILTHESRSKEQLTLVFGIQRKATASDYTLVLYDEGIAKQFAPKTLGLTSVTTNVGKFIETMYLNDSLVA
jgi:hypothetical protein